MDSSSASMEVDQKEMSIVPFDEAQNGVLPEIQSIIYGSKNLEDDLRMLGLKIKQHEKNIKVLTNEKNKLEDSILDMQDSLDKNHSSTLPSVQNNDDSHNQSVEETIQKILQYERSAAGILCKLKLDDVPDASYRSLTKDMVGIVATLGKADDDILSRVLSNYLGLETMLAIVCKTYAGVKALEMYDKEGHINEGSGLHGLATSMEKDLDGRFIVFCLDDLRPYCGQFVTDDPQRRLDLLQPKLPNGKRPPGFIGFAVNMINVESKNLFCLTASGCGLRETLFYNLFFRLQVYKTRDDMLHALPCISDGAISLDGGLITATGAISVGKRNDVDIRFPKPSMDENTPENYIETEKQLRVMDWEKGKVLEDMRREESLLVVAKKKFREKQDEFIKFLAQSSSYATQGPCRTSDEVTKENFGKFKYYRRGGR